MLVLVAIRTSNVNVFNAGVKVGTFSHGGLERVQIDHDEVCKKEMCKFGARKEYSCVSSQ